VAPVALVLLTSVIVVVVLVGGEAGLCSISEVVVTGDGIGIPLCHSYNLMVAV
jgi:hypothetical protein